MLKGNILIIDDEEKLRKLLSRIIELEGYHVFQAGDIKSGLKILELEKEIMLVITDVKLPDGNGIELLRVIKEKYPLYEVIVITAYGTIHDGVQAMKTGAFDYLTKGDDDDQIIVTVARAIEKAKMQKRIIDLESKLETRYNFDNIVCVSKVMQMAVNLAKRVSATDSTVLLEGETGVGKELFAQSIHNSSLRKNKPLIAVNCSAIPRELLESEMFGHKKGAFTGANFDKKGLFEEANEGTLFLDEIGDMSLDLQAKLLRVIETQTFTKVGDIKTTRVSVRIIAATNQDLKQNVEKGLFRADLYYRLSVFKIKVPSLGDRKEDIEPLTNTFINLYAAKIKKKLNGYDDEFMNKLIKYDWKGNIRELKNVIERAVILADKEILTADLLPFEVFTGAYNKIVFNEPASLEELERMQIKKILILTKGNKSKASEILGIGLTTLYRKIEQYGLEDLS